MWQKISDEPSLSKMKHRSANMSEVGRILIEKKQTFDRRIIAEHTVAYRARAYFIVYWILHALNKHFDDIFARKLIVDII